MKSLSFVFKNIKTFLLHHPIMFFFLIVVQIICCIGVFIVCGMANNMYYVENTEDNTDFRFFVFSFGENKSYKLCHEFDSQTKALSDRYYIYKGEKTYSIDYSDCPSVAEMRPKIDELALFLQEDLQYIYLLMTTDTATHLDDLDSPYDISSSISGEDPYANKTFEDSDKNVFCYGGKSNKYQPGDTIDINGIEYSYVGKTGTGYSLPYKVLQDRFRVRALHILLTEIPTEKRLNEINGELERLFGSQLRVSQMPEPYDPLEQQLNQMVYVISLVVMVIILLAIAKFYGYVLTKRRQSLTVLRLCGSTRGQVHLIYMIEILLTMLVTSTIGFVLFRFVLFEPIASLYPSFEEFYTTDIYITILAAYIILALIIMAFTVIPSTKASIVDMKRGR